MNKQHLTAALVALGLMAGAAALLARMHTGQRLGQPGVKVVPLPMHGPEGRVIGTNKVDLPATVPGFASEEMPIAQEVLDWLPKDTTYGRRIYRADDGLEIQLNVVLMGTDRTSIHKPEYCLTGQGFAIDKKELLFIDVKKPHLYRLPVVRMTLSKEFPTKEAGKVMFRALYVFWFVADQEVTADHNKRFLSMAGHMLRTGELQRWAYVSCLAAWQDAPGEEPSGFAEAVYARMRDFIAATVPEFQMAVGPASAPAAP
jgi:hypothetical protein